jgi:complement component 1 Q subcomponent-binding protein
VFADLDEGLQDEFHSYLQARGFDKELAAFVPQYIEMKEQKEYCSWLKNVAAFVKRG